MRTPPAASGELGVTPGTPIVCVDVILRRGVEQAFTWTKPSASSEIGAGDFEDLAASLFAFSATFEICRNDRSCHHAESPNRGRARDSLIRARICLFARFNSL
jgi:hypothetical protein